MILIAESGSSKTDWALASPESTRLIQSPGMNPYFATPEELACLLAATFNEQNKVLPEKIFFYGAGCGAQFNRDKLRQALHNTFPSARQIEVETDLLAAGRALLDREHGIACILGTGANSAVFDKGEITAQVRSLGYLLGDQGSGAALGLGLLKMYMKEELDKSLSASLEELYGIEYLSVLEDIYKKTNPNRYFARFCPFIAQNIVHPQIKQLAEEEFNAFFAYFVERYPLYKELQVGIVGSVGYHFRDMLTEIAKRRDIMISRFLKKTIDSLVSYHRKDF